MTFVSSPENIFVRIGMILISVVLVAVGIFLYLPANIIPLAGEGVMQAVSTVTKIAFPKVKVAFDITMVIISLITCFIVLHSLGSVGLGTIIAAVLVGTVLGWITKIWATHKKRKMVRS
jgi:uncharacterized membrane protein YczE